MCTEVAQSQTLLRILHIQLRRLTWMARTAPAAKDSTVITKDYSVVDDPSSIVAKNYSVVDDPSWIASSVAKDYSVVDDPSSIASSIASSVAKVKPSHGLHGNGLKRGPPMDMVDHL
jgi:hypothetical protein